jgi:hypothetical protein
MTNILTLLGFFLLILILFIASISECFEGMFPNVTSVFAPIVILFNIAFLLFSACVGNIAV